MIENYKSGLIWNISNKSPHIVAGLRNAGFKGGWLDVTLFFQFFKKTNKKNGPFGPY